MCPLGIGNYEIRVQNLKDSGEFPVDFRRNSGGFPADFRWISGGIPVDFRWISSGGFVINENKHSVDILCIEIIVNVQN